MARGEFTEATRAVIRDRADHRCEICGTRMAYGGQIHHRQPRGMGGTKIKGKESAANGIYVHNSCHRMIESERERAYMLGWLVKSNMSTASQEIKLWDGWFLLTDEGARLPHSPEN